MSMLDGLRVLELADGLVDLGGRMLAELGADVVSVVSPEPRAPGRDLAWGHGKRRVSGLSGAALAAALSEADIVLDDRRRTDRPEVDAALAGNTRVIHVVARPFSPNGPAAAQPATDLTLLARAGFLHIIGEPDAPPLRFPGEQAYALTGIQVATAALLALHARRRDGLGQRVEVSALQSTTLANYREAIMYEWTGRIGRRTGNRLVRGKSGVRQIWPCADGHVTWSMIDNPGMMRAVVGVMVAEGAAGELADVDWGSILVADLPQDTIDRWQGIIATFFARHSKAQLGQWSLEKGWGLSVIQNLPEVRDSAHLAARGLFVTIDDRETGRQVRLPGPLFGHGAGDGGPERVYRAAEPADDRPIWGARG